MLKESLTPNIVIDISTIKLIIMPKRFRRRRMNKRHSKKGMVKLIKKVIRNEAEQKFFEQFLSGAGITASSNFVSSLTDIGQGTNFFDRVGVEIQPDLLNLRFHLFLASNPGIPISARVFIIQNMVDDNPAALPTNVVSLMPNLVQAMVPYRILYDRTFDMSLGGDHQSINKTVRIPASRLKHIKWTGSATTIYTQGKIQFHVITDTIITDFLDLNISYRLIFHDT